MNIENIESIYFIGAGGIGMSNLERYFLSKGKRVAGYDRVETPLTMQLIKEGVAIHYEDSTALIPDYCKDKTHTMVVYTPAIADTNSELSYFRSNGFRVLKRAQLLGEITLASKGLCVSGTHGKTTTSSMLAHLLKQSSVDCNAFLGGILKNYDSNLMLSSSSPYTVIEADEFDRSFHWLHPYMAVITAIDADHLDIYGTKEEVVKSFEHFTSLLAPDGVLLIKKGLDLQVKAPESTKVFHYSMSEKADFYADKIQIGHGKIIFDFVSPSGVVKDVELGVPVKINIENAVAAMALAQLCGVTGDEMRNAMRTFAGAKRRFDIHVRRNNVVYLDDYAHHPAEVKACVESVRALYPDKRITGIFQPHLYTRTRDFADEFAQALSLLDDIILMEIYPAREQPIPGVSSRLILDRIDRKEKVLCQDEEVLDLVKSHDYDVLLTIGAGNIDRFIEPITALLEKC